MGYFTLLARSGSYVSLRIPLVERLGICLFGGVGTSLATNWLGVGTWCTEQSISTTLSNCTVPSWGSDDTDAGDDNGDVDEPGNDKSNHDGAFDDVGLCGMSKTGDAAMGTRDAPPELEQSSIS